MPPRWFLSCESRCVPSLSFSFVFPESAASGLVQRGDAEMSNKLWRVVRACVELGARNPIQQIHDQGAGGNCNVVKEIIYPLGAEIDIRAIKLGDETMSVLEIWGAEYQENDALLIKPEARGLLEEVCRRERCNMQV